MHGTNVIYTTLLRYVPSYIIIVIILLTTDGGAILSAEAHDWGGS